MTEGGKPKCQYSRIELSDLHRQWGLCDAGSRRIYAEFDNSISEGFLGVEREARRRRRRRRSDRRLSESKEERRLKWVEG